MWVSRAILDEPRIQCHNCIATRNRSYGGIYSWSSFSLPFEAKIDLILTFFDVFFNIQKYGKAIVSLSGDILHTHQMFEGVMKTHLKWDRLLHYINVFVPQC